MKEIDAIDKKLLNVLQNDFPIIDKPFESIGKKLCISEQEVIGRIESLEYEKNIIRHIGPIFDTKKLGYKSSLASFKVSENEIDKVAETINKDSGVSHNYKRDCEYNLWFTIAVSPEEDLENVCKKFIKLPGVIDYMFLPVLKTYKIGVKFDLDSNDEKLEELNTSDESVEKEAENKELSEKDIIIIRALQDNLDLVHKPFKNIADRLNISQTELFDSINKFLESGIMRRFAALLNHRSAGFLSNAMVVWNVNEESIDRYGEFISKYKAVSHCYRRAVYPNWQYQLYSMIHADTKEKCDGIINDIANKIDYNEHKTIYSIKEYKKERVRYFPEE